MGDQEHAQPSLNDARGLAPGLLVSFAPKLWGTEETAVNRTRFPHVSGTGLGEAAPDLLTFVSELGAADGRTVDDIVETTATATNADRRRLRRFVTALDKAGYLVAEPTAAAMERRAHARCIGRHHDLDQSAVPDPRGFELPGRWSSLRLVRPQWHHPPAADSCGDDRDPAVRRGRARRSRRGPSCHET